MSRTKLPTVLCHQEDSNDSEDLEDFENGTLLVVESDNSRKILSVDYGNEERSTATHSQTLVPLATVQHYLLSNYFS